jgi:hypothetical protein
MISDAIKAAGLSFILGMRIPHVPYVVARWRRENPGRTDPRQAGIHPALADRSSTTSTATTGLGGSEAHLSLRQPPVSAMSMDTARHWEEALPSAAERYSEWHQGLESSVACLQGRKVSTPIVSYKERMLSQRLVFQFQERHHLLVRLPVIVLRTS